MFILGCNLMGMLPWVGAPSASFGMTLALALVVFFPGVIPGIRKFGLLGYLKNLMPSLGLPMYLAVIIVPMVWFIEFVSLFIKHGILALRLLANMVAGHMVLLGILGLAVERMRCDGHCPVGSDCFRVDPGDHGVEFYELFVGLPASLRVYVAGGYVHRKFDTSSLVL